MRSVLLIVALFGLVAAAAAQSALGTYTLKGNLYTDNACTTGAQSVTLAYTISTSSVAYPCQQLGSGSTGIAVQGFCENYSYGGTAYQTWNILAYTAGTCPTSTSAGSIPTGYTSVYGTSGSDFSTCEQYLAGTGSFKPSSCSSASTLVVPSFLLVALAFVAAKLSL